MKVKETPLRHSAPLGAGTSPKAPLGVKKELEEMRNNYLRALADYQNLEKRLNNQIEDVKKKTKKHIVSQFLDVLDTIEKAEVFVKDDGLTMVKNSFLGILQNNGVKEIELVGTEYDPYLAEAIDVVEADTDNIVAEVIRKGYMLGDDVIRHAQVKVTKKITN